MDTLPFWGISPSFKSPRRMINDLSLALSPISKMFSTKLVIFLDVIKSSGSVINSAPSVLFVLRCNERFTGVSLLGKEESKATTTSTVGSQCSSLDVKRMKETSSRVIIKSRLRYFPLRTLSALESFELLDSRLATQTEETALEWRGDPSSSWYKLERTLSCLSIRMNDFLLMIFLLAARRNKVTSRESRIDWKQWEQ